MAERDIIKWFYVRYEQDPERYYSALEVSKELNIEKSAVYKQIKRLFIFGSLVMIYKKRYSNGHMCYDSGANYRLNPLSINKFRVMFANEIIGSNTLQKPEHRETYLSTIKKITEKKTGKEVF